MARPSTIGTPVFSGSSGSVTSHTVTSVTIPSGCNAILGVSGGYRGSTPYTVDSVVLDSGGVDEAALTSVTQVLQTTTYECFGSIYVIYSDDANWPGAGTWDVLFTGSGSAQMRCGVFCLQDVDLTTKVRASGTDTGPGTGPAVTLTSSADDLLIGSLGYYSQAPTAETGLIGQVANGGSSSSVYCWSEDGTGASDTIETAHSSSVSYGLAAASFAGVSSGGAGPNTLTLLGVG